MSSDRDISLVENGYRNFSNYLEDNERIVQRLMSDNSSRKSGGHGSVYAKGTNSDEYEYIDTTEYYDESEYIEIGDSSGIARDRKKRRGRFHKDVQTIGSKANASSYATRKKRKSSRIVRADENVDDNYSACGIILRPRSERDYYGDSLSSRNSERQDTLRSARPTSVHSQLNDRINRRQSKKATYASVSGTGVQKKTGRINSVGILKYSSRQRDNETARRPSNFDSQNFSSETRKSLMSSKIRRDLNKVKQTKATKEPTQTPRTPRTNSYLSNYQRSLRKEGQNPEPIERRSKSTVRQGSKSVSRIREDPSIVVYDTTLFRGLEDTLSHIDSNLIAKQRDIILRKWASEDKRKYGYDVACENDPFKEERRPFKIRGIRRSHVDVYEGFKEEEPEYVPAEVVLPKNPSEKFIKYLNTPVSIRLSESKPKKVIKRKFKKFNQDAFDEFYSRNVEFASKKKIRESSDSPKLATMTKETADRLFKYSLKDEYFENRNIPTFKGALVKNRHRDVYREESPSVDDRNVKFDINDRRWTAPKQVLNPVVEEPQERKKFISENSRILVQGMPNILDRSKIDYIDKIYEYRRERDAALFRQRYFETFGRVLH